MESVIHQVDVSVGITIAHMLSASYGDMIDPLDVCLMSVVTILVSHVVPSNDRILQLGRRLSCLLLLDKLTPVVRSVVSHRMGVQAAILDVGLLALLAIVPLQSTYEGKLIYTSVVYVFVSIVREDPPLWVAPLCVLAIVWASSQQGSKSHLWEQFLMIVSIVATSTLTNLVVANNDGLQDEAKLLKMCLELVLLGAALQSCVAQSAHDFLIYSVASTLQTMVQGQLAAVFLLLIFLERFLGVGQWITQVVLLVFTGLVVEAALGYIVSLAAVDTIVTLKVSALVLQFLIYESSVCILR